MINETELIIRRHGQWRQRRLLTTHPQTHRHQPRCLQIMENKFPSVFQFFQFSVQL